MSEQVFKHIHNWFEEKEGIWYCITCDERKPEPKNFKPKRLITTHYVTENDFLIPKVNGMYLKYYVQEQEIKSLNIKKKISQTCKKHKWKKDTDQGCFVCTKCLTEDPQILISPADLYKPTIKIWIREHDRKRWNNEYLDYLNGTHLEEINDQTWYFILQEIPPVFSWYQVYKVFQKYRLLNHWISFGAYIGFKSPVTPKVVSYANKYTNCSMTGKHRIPHLFLIYKFAQLFGEENSEQNVPIKHTKLWISRVNKWWAQFCKENNFEYKETRIHELKWDKDEFMKRYKYKL